jgi:hypothetical protein
MPTATTTPAVMMIGAHSAVVRRAAGTRRSPSASRDCIPARKKTV